MPTPGTRVLSNQRITVWIGPSSAIANYLAPTRAEILAMVNISEALKWDGFDFGLDSSSQADDRSLTDGAGAQSRSYTEFGGAMEFFTPKNDDTSSILRVARNIVKRPRTELAVVTRIVTLSSVGIAVGDEINAYRVMTDANRHNRSEVSYSYTINLVPRDDVAVNAIVPSVTPTAVVLTPSTSVSTTVGKVGFHTAVYEGRNVTIGTRYVSSNEAVIEALPHGGWRAVGVGTATVTPSYPGSASGAAKSFTVAA